LAQAKEGMVSELGGQAGSATNITLSFSVLSSSVSPSGQRSEADF
jgi:hypothetical protein